MKKAIIILSIISICLLGLNVFSYVQMNASSVNYNNKIDEYKQTNLKLNENETTIVSLNSDLNKVINDNNNNKEYKAWKSLIDQLATLIND